MKDTITQPAGTAEEGGNGSAHINKGFVILPTQLLADVAARKISGSAYALYAFLLFWQGTNSKLWYGVKSIAKETGLSQSKVKRLLKELISARHIKRTKTMSNSHTECLTRVDKSRKVFVCGEPADVFLRRDAAKKGDSESVRCEERATAFAKSEYSDLADSIPANKPKDSLLEDGLSRDANPLVSEEEEVRDIRRLFEEPNTTGDRDEPTLLFGDDEPKAPPGMAHEEAETPPTEEEFAAQKAFADSLF